MEDFNKKVKKIVYFFITIFIISLIVIIICLLMLKYEVEGEGNMPFELSQIVVISTAEGINTEGEKIWNFDVVQNNDIYLHISKNKSYKETEIIKSITLDNFIINEKPEKGNIVIYKPTKRENVTYEYSEEYIVENSLMYQGEESSNLKELQIANQGGVIALRYCNNEIR